MTCHRIADLVHICTAGYASNVFANHKSFEFRDGSLISDDPFLTSFLFFLSITPAAIVEAYGVDRR